MVAATLRDRVEAVVTALVDIEYERQTVVAPKRFRHKRAGAISAMFPGFESWGWLWRKLNRPMSRGNFELRKAYDACIDAGIPIWDYIEADYNYRTDDDFSHMSMQQLARLVDEERLNRG